MSKTFIIAEAGVNHNGSLDLALQLVDSAAAAGADAVKFQTFRADAIVRKGTQKADYQKAASGADESQHEMLEKLELDEKAHRDLMVRCRERGIAFLSTAFDIASAELLAELGLDIWKIPSGEITDLPMLRKIGAFRRSVLLSTGMATLGEVEAALAEIENAGTPRSRITVLHCSTEYPAPLAEVNLKAMVVMGTAFGTAYGYSDHTEGSTVPIAAVALGATVIEKHFTLDRGLRGPDHKASLEPEQLSGMIRAIREVEAAMGDGIKRPGAAEFKNRIAARKSIVIARSVAKGQTIKPEDLSTKRPGDGVSPMEWDRVIGCVSRRDYASEEPFAW